MAPLIEYSTGICAMVRTILFTNGTGEAEQGERLMHLNLVYYIYDNDRY